MCELCSLDAIIVSEIANDQERTLFCAYYLELISGATFSLTELCSYFKYFLTYSLQQMGRHLL